MSNGDAGNGGTTHGTDNKFDIVVLNNGVKLLGEAVIPGASLMLEKHIGAGVLLGAIGVLGGAAFGSVFGPLGYFLARYGASAVSFSQSMEPEPAPPKTNGQATRAMAAAADRFATAVTRAVQQSAPFAAQQAAAFAPQQAAAFTPQQPPPYAPQQPAAFTPQQPPPYPPQQPAAYPPQPTLDIAEQFAVALRKLAPEFTRSASPVTAAATVDVSEQLETMNRRLNDIEQTMSGQAAAPRGRAAKDKEA